MNKYISRLLHKMAYWFYRESYEELLERYNELKKKTWRM